MLPLLPLVYVARANGELTNQELETLRELAREQSWLAKDACKILSTWLDPNDPPTATEIGYLLETIRAASNPLDASKRGDLATLGLEMARFYEVRDDESHRSLEQVRGALRELQMALG